MDVKLGPCYLSIVQVVAAVLAVCLLEYSTPCIPFGRILQLYAAGQIGDFALLLLQLQMHFLCIYIPKALLTLYVPYTVYTGIIAPPANTAEERLLFAGDRWWPNGTHSIC